jgi:type IV fimbrial biogenesis protein FimT
MKTYRSKVFGFTLIELMVALSIAAIMMVFALPAFNDFTAQRRMTANVNSMIAAINYARSEATRLGGVVTVQASNGGAAGNEWGPGFCVTPADPGDCAASIQTFDMGGTITFDSQGGQDSMSFNSRGLLLGTADTIELCGADADDDPGRSIDISAIGRASIQTLVCFP